MGIVWFARMVKRETNRRGLRPEEVKGCIGCWIMFTASRALDLAIFLLSPNLKMMAPYYNFECSSFQ